MSREGFDEDYRPIRDRAETDPARPRNVNARDEAPSLAKNVGVFFLCCALNFVAMCLTYVVYVVEPGRSSPAPGFLCTAWAWVFIFPCMLAYALGIQSLAGVLLILNPFIYGVLWWRLWRAVRRMTRKSPKKSSSPRQGR